MLYLICDTNYEKFKKPRSFESEYSLEKKDYYTFLVLRAFDGNHVKAAYIDDYGFSKYVVIKGKFFDSTKVKYKNPIIIGRYRHYGDYFPVVTEGNVKENSFYSNTSKLMEKPTDEEIKNISGYLGAESLSDLYSKQLYGKDMKNHHHHARETTWSFPKGIKEKIEDNKKYLVYYDFHDSADSSDTSIHYKVYYIEEC